MPVRSFKGGLAFLALTGAVLLAGSAEAQDAACRAATRRVGDTLILPAWCTVGVEHADRKARLARLARLRHMVEPPRYSEYVVARADLQSLLPNFPADVPVLRVVFSEQVFFDFDKAAVREEAAEVLDLIAESLQREPPDVAMFIAGHTDAIGSDAYNTDLADRRADAVAHALLDRGVGLSSVFRVAFGESMPVDSNLTDEGRQHNRRVEFLFAAKPEAAAVWLAKQAVETCYSGDPSSYQRCRMAISVAEEVSRATPRLADRTESAELAPERTQRADLALGGRRTIAPSRPARATATLRPQGTQGVIPQTRTFAIDLGRRAVSIRLPRR